MEEFDKASFQMPKGDGCLPKLLRSFASRETQDDARLFARYDAPGFEASGELKKKGLGNLIATLTGLLNKKKSSSGFEDLEDVVKRYDDHI